MYERVMVPLDRSELSRRSLPYAELIASALNARLELLHVVRWSRTLRTTPGLELEPWTEIEQAATADASRYLESIASPLRARGLEVTQAVLLGDPAEEIIGEARAGAETLVVMATHGESGLGHWTLGSVTGKVMHRNVRPTLVVRASEAPAVEQPAVSSIILPLDGSTESESAMPHAVALAKALDAGIVVLRSIGPGAYGYADFGAVAPETYARLHESIETEVRGYLDDVTQRLNGLGVRSVERATPLDAPDSAIVAMAGDGTGKMVVMTSHIRRIPDGVTFGSVTDRVVRHSAAPVLVVPPARGEG